MSINKFDIGPQLNTYRGYRIRNNVIIATISSFIILILIPFLIGLYRTLYGYAQYGPVAALSWGFPWLSFSFVCFLLISIFVIYRLNIAKFSIILHKHGIIIHKMLRKTQIFRWEDISALYVIKHQSRSTTKSINTKAVIFTTENVRLSLQDSMIENLPELLTQIKASVYVHLYPEIQDRFHAGEVISFGPINLHSRYIKINRGGINRQSPKIPFTDIYRITVKSGQLLIKLNNNQDFQISTAKIPNIEILLDLISNKTNI